MNFTVERCLRSGGSLKADLTRFNFEMRVCGMRVLRCGKTLNLEGKAKFSRFVNGSALLLSDSWVRGLSKAKMRHERQYAAMRAHALVRFRLLDAYVKPVRRERSRLRPLWMKTDLH